MFAQSMILFAGLGILILVFLSLHICAPLLPSKLVESLEQVMAQWEGVCLAEVNPGPSPALHMVP